ncbi:hypothetical protein PIB30_007648 [Stylosanthes scabra]|uniref:Uncharacterized protein n=1 Tax=Stylosanthes scabra TaxID=79078 RepID=A0ABU6V766_9FABA|nr:hypothetical protein [Stylosanthes scabra]
MDILAEIPKFPERQPSRSISERFQALFMKDSSVLYEDPYIQIGVKAEWRAHHGHMVLFLGNKNTAPLLSFKLSCCLPPIFKMELSLVLEAILPCAQVARCNAHLEVINLRSSRDFAVLDLSYKFGNDMPISIAAKEFFPQWISLPGSPLKLQEVVRGVRPLPLIEMANLFNGFRLTVCPGLDPNPNNLVLSTTFYLESTRAMLCPVGDPAQLPATISDVAKNHG